MSSATLQQQMHNKIDIAGNFIKKKEVTLWFISDFTDVQISALLKFSSLK